jgi:hypothetical protein
VGAEVAEDAISTGRMAKVEWTPPNREGWGEGQIGEDVIPQIWFLNIKRLNGFPWWEWKIDIDWLPWRNDSIEAE